MNKWEQLNKILEENRGYIKTADLKKGDIPKPVFYNFVFENNLTNVSHGLYMAEDIWRDDLYVLQTRYPVLVFSHEVAAYLLDLVDREPLVISTTLPTGSSSSRLNKEGIKVYKIKQELFELGLSETETPMGNLVRIYNLERTLCDLIRNRRNIENQDLQTVIKNYFTRKDKNIPRLMRYAEMFSITNIIRQYTDILL
jgi:predicted transcriptional regulator of viral defense system